MPFARILPAVLPPRFAAAPRYVATVPDGTFELLAAERFWPRLRGLAGLDAEAIVPLLFPRCRSLHTFGMRVPIDVVWLAALAGGKSRVLAAEAAVAPRRLASAPAGSPRGATLALELPAGDAAALGLSPGTVVALTG